MVVGINIHNTPASWAEIRVRGSTWPRGLADSDSFLNPVNILCPRAFAQAVLYLEHSIWSCDKLLLILHSLSINITVFTKPSLTPRYTLWCHSGLSPVEHSPCLY